MPYANTAERDLTNKTLTATMINSMPHAYSALDLSLGMLTEGTLVILVDLILKCGFMADLSLCLPRVVLVEESKTGLGFEIGP